MIQKAPIFQFAGKDEFVKVLRERVNNYFVINKKSKSASVGMYVRAISLILLWSGNFSLILFAGFPTWVNYILFAIQGISVALVSVNVGHDAIHGAFSSKKWVNDLFSHTFNLNGASAYMWSKMHNMAHHTYTNIHGHDEDVESVPALRLSPSTELKNIHKHQYWYSFLMYGLATISWVFKKDYEKFFKNQVGNYSGASHPKREYFFLFFYKAVYYTIFLVLPFIFINQPWYHTLGGLFVMHYCAGFYLAVVFMLAHIVESTHFPLPSESGSMENTWAVHQLYTTANFARKNKIAAFLTGGLNLQVEHHLFPNICSGHYYDIASIVKQTTQDFGLPYLEYPTFISALRSHVRFLKAMGRIKDYKPQKEIMIAA